jgi:hypothetical protein
MRGFYARSGVYARLEMSPSVGMPLVALYMQPVRVYKYFCLLLQVEVLGLAGFLYPSSGLLPWQEPGRQISRTEGSCPRQRAWWLLRGQCGKVKVMGGSGGCAAGLPFRSGPVSARQRQEGGLELPRLWLARLWPRTMVVLGLGRCSSVPWRHGAR